MTTDTTPTTADRLITLWQEILDELEIPGSGIRAELIKTYTTLFARFQLERVAVSLRTDKYFSAAREVESRSNALEEL
jgi:hypothetical protein